MLTTIILSALTALIFVDGLSTASLDKMRPNWATGAILEMEENGTRSTIDYTYPLYGDNSTIATVLTGITTPSTESISLSDIYRLRYGYNTHVYAIGRDTETARLMAGHAADAYYVRHSNDSVLQWANELIRLNALGRNQTRHDLLILSLSALADDAGSDILTYNDEERIYFQLANQLRELTGKARIIMVGVPRLGLGRERMERMGLKLRDIHPEEIGALTNAYLMAIYGMQQWVESVDHRGLILSQKAVDATPTPIDDITKRVAAFLTGFEAIDKAWITTNPLHICYQIAEGYSPFPRNKAILTYPIIVYPREEIADTIKDTEILNLL